MSTIHFDKMPRKLWEHPNRENTIMWRFMKDANRKYGLNLQVSISSPTLPYSLLSL
jgi:acetoacetyl-CoA synthetase